MSFEKLHERALELVRNFQRDESELISILQQVEQGKGFKRLGFTSLYQYATVGLKLSESHSYALITVSRKAKLIPELKEAISNGTINSSQARRITSVITPENKDEWIDKAASLKQRDLEKSVVTVKPKEAVKETMNFVASDRVKLVCGISEKLMKEIERAKDIHAQKTKKAPSLEETLEEMVELYLKKHDPVKKAQRVLAKPEKLSSSRVNHKQSRRQPIVARTKHEVIKRDQGQCNHRDKNGRRCEQKRWLDVHHRVPVSQGGTNQLDNLVTLCKTHHSFQHQLQL